MNSPPKLAISVDAGVGQTNGQRYEAVLRLSEALSLCQEPEDLTKVLSEQLREFLDFFQFYIVVYKENSTEVEWAVVGREKNLISAAYADLSVQQRPSWQAYNRQEPIYIRDWNTDEGIPIRLRQGITDQGLDVGPLVFVPLTTPQRRLGALGMSGHPGISYSRDDISFLRLIGRVVALAIDDNFNLKRAEAANAELQRQNERLQQSERELREIIETIPCMAWSAAANGAAQFFNRRWLDYAGLTADQVENWGWTVAVHPDDLNALADYWRTVVVSGQSGEIEGRLRRFDGVYRWFLFRATPSHDDKGNVAKWYGTNTDIDDRKKAEQALTVQNSRLQLLLKVTNQITANLELRDVLREISACIREVMDCDVVHISVRENGTGEFRIYALDFPEGKGLIKEDLVITPTGAGRRALDTLKPTIRSIEQRREFPPDYYELLVAEGVKSQYVIPLVNRGQAVGVLAISRTTDTPFTSEDVDFVSEASGQIAIAIENSLAYREVSELKERLAQENRYLEQEIRGDIEFGQIVGNSPALKHVLRLVETVAPTDSTVLLLGETGTGKELVARAVHDHSRRKDRIFVKVNCAAIPTGLLESELFGHEKGAFTGAISQKIGRLELADGGTFFLDEVADIPSEVQPKLLRALQEQEFERLGSTRTVKVDVRLIAATNRDLEKMVASREFRSDLYYRLNVFPIRVPPLRERKEDIPLLVGYFVQKFAKQMQKHIKRIPPAVMKAFIAWDWPGNIRELENVVERSVILTRGRGLETPQLESWKSNTQEHEHETTDSRHEEIAKIVRNTLQALNKKPILADTRQRKGGERAAKQRDEIMRALTASKGRVGGSGGAAARLGINRTTLLARMRKLGIDPKEYAA
ncbi:MAG TPA: sigma 54-interacting transcriptional regulator [Candidatus Sulfotelmatobacter sp.]|nr:sigma 54-interacting transcriptional regulator [Candidatus Sulfotelmatobacter sp.]